MTTCIYFTLSDIFGGVVASFVFLILSCFFYWFKWMYYSSKFIGVWEQYEFNKGESSYSICSKKEIRGTIIKRCLINPRIITAKTVTFEEGGYRYWNAKFEFIHSNYCSGEYQYLPDKHKQQWGTNELRTQKKDDGTYILITVQDGGSRKFTGSAQLLKKVTIKLDASKYNMIKNKIFVNNNTK